MAKAAVLPLPVCASPTTSSPPRSSGNARAWIGVGVFQPWSATALRTSLDKDKSAKEVSWTSDITLAIMFCFLSIVVVATIRSVRRGLPLNGRGQAQDTKKEMLFDIRHLDDHGRMFFIAERREYTGRASVVKAAGKRFRLDQSMCHCR